MTPELLNYLCDPQTGGPLTLEEAHYSAEGDIISGKLRNEIGTSFPIIDGIPRFVSSTAVNSVLSFGEEWNYFNFAAFKEHWLQHTIANTFGSVDVFRNKIVVDAGGGSGAQTLWMLEAGARHVIMLELSPSIDDVVQRNLAQSGFRNYDVVQCSIDAPPIRAGSIDGIVYCHNVIQHTESVERTAKSLYRLLACGGEFVFNVYPMNDRGILRWLRFHLAYKGLRAILRRMPFAAILGYARVMAVGREIPLIGLLLEKSGMAVRGDVPVRKGEGPLVRMKRRMRATTLNTYDWFGYHKYQHHKTEDEVRQLVAELQPDISKVANMEKYFARPALPGCALRVFR